MDRYNAYWQRLLAMVTAFVKVDEFVKCAMLAIDQPNLRH